MRYEGNIQVIGFIPVAVEQAGITEHEARALVEADPEKYKCGFVEALVFEAWEDFEKTEEDEPEEERPFP